jgi:hypothetical protein
VVAIVTIRIFPKLDVVSGRQQPPIRLLKIVIIDLEMSQLIALVDSRQPWEHIIDRLSDYEQF